MDGGTIFSEKRNRDIPTMSYFLRMLLFGRELADFSISSAQSKQEFESGLEMPRTEPATIACL